MGCSPSRSDNSKNEGDVQEDNNRESSSCTPCSRKSSKTGVTISIVHPTDNQVVLLRYNPAASSKHRKNQPSESKSSEYFMNIMNSLFFGDEKNNKIDVCFSTLYCKSTDRYHYYLQRLLNIEIESIERPYNGKMWILYINNKPHDWDALVNSNTKFDFNSGSLLSWRYEQLSTPQAQSQKATISHTLTSTNNLSYLKRYFDATAAATTSTSSNSIPQHFPISSSDSNRTQKLSKRQHRSSGYKNSTFSKDDKNQNMQVPLPTEITPMTTQTGMPQLQTLPSDDFAAATLFNNLPNHPETINFQSNNMPILLETLPTQQDELLLS